MRARNIKPGFFKNETLAECSFQARLLFAGLWCMADREGRLEKRPLRIKAELFPYDNIDINGELTVIERMGFVKTYVVDEKEYLQVLGFHEHQRPHHTEAASKLPEMTAENVLTVNSPLSNGEYPPDSLIHRFSDSPIHRFTDSLKKEESKSQAQKNEKSPPREAALITVPDFVDPASWFGFIEMRKKIKKPATTRAMEMLIKKLVMFHNAGHDANAILDQSTVNGWQDLYELKDDNKGRHQQGQTFEQQKMNNTKRAMIDFVGGGNDGSGQKSLCLTDG